MGLFKSERSIGSCKTDIQSKSDEECEPCLSVPETVCVMRETMKVVVNQNVNIVFDFGSHRREGTTQDCQISKLIYFFLFNSHHSVHSLYPLCSFNSHKTTTPYRLCPLSTQNDTKLIAFYNNTQSSRKTRPAAPIPVPIHIETTAAF